MFQRFSPQKLLISGSITIIPWLIFAGMIAWPKHDRASSTSEFNAFPAHSDPISFWPFLGISLLITLPLPILIAGIYAIVRRMQVRWTNGGSLEARTVAAVGTAITIASFTLLFLLSPGPRSSRLSDQVYVYVYPLFMALIAGLMASIACFLGSILVSRLRKEA